MFHSPPLHISETKQCDQQGIIHREPQQVIPEPQKTTGKNLAVNSGGERLTVDLKMYDISTITPDKPHSIHKPPAITLYGWRDQVG